MGGRRSLYNPQGRPHIARWPGCPSISGGLFPADHVEGRASRLRRSFPLPGAALLLGCQFIDNLQHLYLFNLQRRTPRKARTVTKSEPIIIDYALSIIVNIARTSLDGPGAVNLLVLACAACSSTPQAVRSSHGRS